MQEKRKGFTLIETLVSSAIFILLTFSGYKAFGVLMNAVTASRAKLAATSIANEKFEIIRNLPYLDVGILGGLPVGKLTRTQNISRDNYSFTIQTTIRSVDDPFDGTIGGNPPDSSSADYKLADLDITCTNCKNLSPLKFTTLIAPRALETASNNGALFVQIFDAGGVPVSNATLRIVNTQTNPDTIIDEVTDNNGWVKIVDAPPGINAYNIVATKSGYTQDQTYIPGGGAGPNPLTPDPTVVVQQVTQTPLSIDKVSSLMVSTVDSDCATLPSIGFSLTGSKLIGAPAVLKYPTQNFTTDTLGTFNIPNLEWDPAYGVLLSSASYDLAGTTLLPNFALNPNENQNLKLVVVPHVNTALLVTVKDSVNNPINGATVQLQKGEFNQTKTTNSGTCATPGQTFWNGLASGTYSLTVSKSGYTTYENNSLNITPSWQNQTIILNP